MSLFAELRRRNVFRVGAAYLVGSWLVIQVVETIFPAFGFGDAAVRLGVTVLAIGLVPVLVFAWAFEITPEGLKLEKDVDRSRSITSQTGKKLDRLIMVALALALGFFAFDKFVLSESREASIAESARREGRAEAILESYGDRSIVVLPFADMSAGRDQEYLSDGIAEELLNLLARVPELRVISRRSAFAFKDKDLEVSEIAERLNVAHALEGSIRKSGNTVRITAQLVDARSDTNLWSATYDRALEDIFRIQDEVAGEVVKALKIELGVGQQVPSVAATPPTDEMEAYRLYLQAQYVGRQITPDSLQSAVDLYRQALAIDPEYVPAWDGLSGRLTNMANSGLLPEEGYEPAREAALEALEIDPEFGRSHSRLGWIALFGDGDLQSAASHFERALELDPTDLVSLGDAATLYQMLGRLDEAIEIKKYVSSRDPVYPPGYANLGIAEMYAGRLEDAATRFRETLTLSPNYIGAQCLLAMTMLLRGDASGALRVAERESFAPFRLICLALAHHSQGNAPASDEALGELIEKHAAGWSYNIAYVYAHRGDADAAFDWLRKAVQYKDAGLADIAIQPFFGNLYSDERWNEFLTGLGKSKAQLAAVRFSVDVPK